MIQKQTVIQLINDWLERLDDGYAEDVVETVLLIMKNKVEGLAEEDQWIPCSERLPTVETKVLICAKRKYKGEHFHHIITTAMYEDGTVLENDSVWYWEDIEGEWDEENDCYIIPEGWWEYKNYNQDGELNHAVDDEVIAWMPLPEPYKPPARSWKDSMMRHFEKVE